MNHPLTLLQRGVIQRLRERGFHLAAAQLREHWDRGMQCPREVLSGLDPERDRELLADFEKVNARADQPS